MTVYGLIGVLTLSRLEGLCSSYDQKSHYQLLVDLKKSLSYAQKANIINCINVEFDDIESEGGSSSRKEQSDLLKRLGSLDSVPTGSVGSPSIEVDESSKIISEGLDISDLYINRNGGEGRCFYHSVYESLTGLRSSESAQSSIRARVIDSILTDMDVMTHLFGDSPLELAVSDTLDHIFSHSEWIDNWIPSLVAEALNIEIQIFRADTGVLYYTAAPTVVRGHPQVVRILYNGVHYESLTEHPAIDE